MRLTVFNGSPRAEQSNTRIFLEQILAGCEEVEGNSHTMYYLRKEDLEEMAGVFADSEVVLLGFPLYTDAMPALVKEFIEALAPLCGREGNPSLAFLVQSGFPEAVHSRYVERYLEKLASRLGSRYIGTVVKGGGESLRYRPAFANRRLFKQLRKLGRGLGERGELDGELLRRLARPERFSSRQLPLVEFLANRGVFNSGWNRMLKGNKALDRRYDRPYC